MRKPRLTEPVMRGLLSAMSSFCAGDLDGMEESGEIPSVDDVLRAYKWVVEMATYRETKKREATHKP